MLSICCFVCSSSIATIHLRGEFSATQERTSLPRDAWGEGQSRMAYSHHQVLRRTYQPGFLDEDGAIARRPSRAHQSPEAYAQISRNHPEFALSVPAPWPRNKQFFLNAASQQRPAEWHSRQIQRRTTAVQWRAKQHRSSRRQACSFAQFEQPQDQQSAQAVTHQVKRVAFEPTQENTERTSIVGHARFYRWVGECVRVGAQFPT